MGYKANKQQHAMTDRLEMSRRYDGLGRLKRWVKYLAQEIWNFWNWSRQKKCKKRAER